MAPKICCAIILLSGSCSCLRTTAQEIYPTALPKNYHYHIITMLTGVGVLHSGNNNGLLNISFPYSVDGSPDTLFRSGNIRPYASSKVFVLPLGFEIGNLHHFFNAGISFSVIGKFSSGYSLSIGYGYNFYLDGFNHHSEAAEQKTFVLKPSISLAWTQDNGSNRDASLGSIDNEGKTIRVLGKEADPTFDITDSYDDGYGNTTTTTTTYDAKSLDIAYVQHELALMPKIGISNNQYKKGLHWELSVGCNIPLLELGGISLKQNDGNNNTNSVARFIGLNNSGMKAIYDGRPINATPFLFSGLYLDLAFSIPIYKHREF